MSGAQTTEGSSHAAQPRLAAASTLAGAEPSGRISMTASRATVAAARQVVRSLRPYIDRYQEEE
jgi:hypothetical protein